MPGSSSRRRQFFIKKEFQGKFILLYAVSVAVVAGLIGLGLYTAILQAVEAHLYSSHLKVERTGDLLFDILLQINIVSVFVIVLLVIILSILVFGRLNLHFFRMEQWLDAMAAGDFAHPRQPESRFNEISTLIDMVDETRMAWNERFSRLETVLDILDSGCREGGDAERLRAGKKELDTLIGRINLPPEKTQPR